MARPNSMPCPWRYPTRGFGIRYSVLGTRYWVLVFRHFAHSAVEVGGLRENHIFQQRLVRDKSIFGSDPANRRVQVLEQLVGDAGSDLCAVPPAQRILVRDDDSAGPLHRVGDGLPVIRI